ncbi:hypothetical protein MRX96_011492 [Rhipicephalus microplus]
MSDVAFTFAGHPPNLRWRKHRGRVKATSSSTGSPGKNCGLSLRMPALGEGAITADNVERLIVATDQLLVDGLLDECCAFMSRNVDLSNCVRVLEMARFFHLEPLGKQVFRFLLDNFERVYSENCHFHDLSLQTLVDLLASDELKVRREETCMGGDRVLDQGRSQ